MEAEREYEDKEAGLIERRRRADNRVHVVIGQWGPVFAALAFCLFVVLGVLAYGIVNTNRRAADVQEVNKEIAQCLLAEQAYHRERSDFINRKVAERLKFDYPYEQPSITPQELTEAILTACEQLKEAN